MPGIWSTGMVRVDPLFASKGERRASAGPMRSMKESRCICLDNRRNRATLRRVAHAHGLMVVANSGRPKPQCPTSTAGSKAASTFFTKPKILGSVPSIDLLTQNPAEELARYQGSQHCSMVLYFNST